MSTARKLAIAGAAAAVVAGVGASPAVAATDPDLLRLYSAASYPGAQAAIQNAVSYGDRLDSANKKAHDAWPGQVAAYNKALAKYKAALRLYSYWLPVYEYLHRTPPPPPAPPTPPAKNQAGADELGTVRPHRHRQQGGRAEEDHRRQEERAGDRDRNRDGSQRQLGRHVQFRRRLVVAQPGAAGRADRDQAGQPGQDRRDWTSRSATRSESSAPCGAAPPSVASWSSRPCNNDLSEAGPARGRLSFVGTLAATPVVGRACQQSLASCRRAQRRPTWRNARMPGRSGPHGGSAGGTAPGRYAAFR